MLDDREIDTMTLIIHGMVATGEAVSDIRQRIREELPSVTDEEFNWLMARDADWWGRRAERMDRLADVQRKGHG